MTDLRDLKVGNAVALVHHSRWDRRISMTKGHVEKVTKTQAVALDGRRFRLRDGFEVGGLCSYGSPRLCRITPELLAEEAGAQAEITAEKKCFAWSEKLQRARGDEAIALASLLPEPPK